MHRHKIEKQHRRYCEESVIKPPPPQAKTQTKVHTHTPHCQRLYPVFLSHTISHFCVPSLSLWVMPGQYLMITNEEGAEQYAWGCYF